jgi:hypothetical protein
VFDPGSDRRSCSQFRPDESAAGVVIGSVVEPRVGSIERPHDRETGAAHPPVLSILGLKSSMRGP